ncbi:flagellar assembly protein FliW [Clostridium sp. 'deep sea']|uniref:flagellar assembly protein FliW n=1 Tax=Clostridium sp. 'deep sea' TaxID=2779445 RepID=UPI0018967D99|nr:flagellar assembly protein FliW [Clostridium sp. 'deep sea']QOR35365.1 flagellar assembly protein FliW [Clostridium sp. 'deep sea']
MTINTQDYPAKLFSQDTVFTFKNGIYGFENHHQFGFVNQTDDIDNPFRLMVSINNPDISFVVVPPTFVHENYEIKIDDLELQELDVCDSNDIVVVCIVSLAQDGKSIYVNLKSPIVLALSKKRGKQIILDNSPYDIRHVVELGN